ncbi:MAG TPA: DUF982 domain-containing protein [Xanthobacteraceae bacterium]|nr:DUF982 domain-containing protein [Xanthobacteraceae bacterium]
MVFRPFRDPLLAKIDATSQYVVRGAWEALEFLQKYWRGPRDGAYQRALHIARDAVDGFIPAERARSALKRLLAAGKQLVRQ